MRILLVDDEPEFIAEVSEFFRRRGHDVVGVGGVLAAIGELQDNAPFDAVITDLWMPDGRGFDVVEVCRQQAGPQPAVLIISGHGAAHDHIRIQDRTGLHFLAKPVDPNRLLAILIADLEARTPR